jgi:hypothetical protein
MYAFDNYLPVSFCMQGLDSCYANIQKYLETVHFKEFGYTLPKDQRRGTERSAMDQQLKIRLVYQARIVFYLPGGRRKRAVLLYGCYNATKRQFYREKFPDKKYSGSRVRMCHLHKSDNP